MSKITKDELIQELAAGCRRTLMCSLEALHDSWDRSDDGFEAMRDSTADLLGQVPPELRPKEEWGDTIDNEAEQLIAAATRRHSHDSQGT
jgi:hypothetical protein